MLVLAVNMNSGDVDHKMDLHAWSYELPIERRRHIPDYFQPSPPAPPIGLSGFPGRRCNFFVLIKAERKYFQNFGLPFIDQMPKRSFIEQVHRRELS